MGVSKYGLEVICTALLTSLPPLVKVFCAKRVARCHVTTFVWLPVIGQPLSLMPCNHAGKLYSVEFKNKLVNVISPQQADGRKVFDFKEYFQFSK